MTQQHRVMRTQLTRIIQQKGSSHHRLEPFHLAAQHKNLAAVLTAEPVHSGEPHWTFLDKIESSACSTTSKNRSRQTPLKGPILESAFRRRRYVNRYHCTGEFAHEQNKNALYHMRQVVSVGKC